MPSPDQDQVLAAAQAGDRSALQRLLAEHRNGVYRYGLRVCRTTEDAEDAVQETLWAATRALKTFRGTAGSIATWLFTIVRHHCYHLLERRRRDQQIAERAVDAPTVEGSWEDAVSAEEQRQLLAAALATLAPGHREVLLLRDVEGLTAPEAAEKLGLSVEALKSRLHRARVSLMDALEEQRKTSLQNTGHITHP
jgi:RNA polymerase sigma-70 factor (ECF subfamily)